MKRLQWMTMAIGVASILMMEACNILSIVKLRPTATQLPGLPYCDVDHAGLCVVSFGTDINDRMLVNLVKPDSSYPDFYLKISHIDATSVYECQSIVNTPTSVYCTGDLTPLGDPVDIEVYSTDKNRLIASGTLLIAAFAHSTQIVVSVTDTGTPTEGIPVTTAPTTFEIFTTVPPATQALPTTPVILPTLSTPTRTKTPTTVAYPNP
jgi:hypothetical protein